MRFCGEYGTPLEDGTKVCGQCGTPVDGIGGKIPGLKVDDPEKRKKLMKRIKTIVAVVIIAIIGIRTTLSFAEINGVVRNVMTFYKDYNIDALVSISSDIYYYNDYEGYVGEYFKYAVGNVIDSFALALH